MEGDGGWLLFSLWYYPATSEFPRPIPLFWSGGSGPSWVGRRKVFEVKRVRGLPKKVDGLFLRKSLEPSPTTWERHGLPTGGRGLQIVTDKRETRSLREVLYRGLFRKSCLYESSIPWIVGPRNAP